MKPESGPARNTAASPLFPPCLLPLRIMEDILTEASKERLSALAADVVSEPERFDQEIRTKWTAIEADPSSRLNFTGYEQLWETLQYGALLLRSQCNLKVDPPPLKTWCRWCEMLYFLWDKTRNDAAMDVLLQSWELILLLPTIGGIRRYDILSGAFKLYRSRYEASKDRTGFREARLTVDEMVEIARPGREQVEANTLRGRLFGTRVNDALLENVRKIAIDESIKSLQKATEILQTVKEKKSSYPDVYNCLGFALRKRFDIENRKPDIDAAISSNKEAMSMISGESKLWIGWADNLARAYWAKFTEYSQVKDADSGIEIFEQILKIYPDHPHAAAGLAELLRQRAANLVLSNAERRLIMARAIELLENVIVKTSDTDKAMPSRLGKCSSALADRFRTDSVVQDIDLAIALQTTATNLQPPGARWFHLKQLCEYHLLRHKILNTEEDLEAALAKGQECVQAAGPTKENRSGCLLQYGCAQGTAYQKRHAPELLSDAITSMREADKLSKEVLWRNVGILDNLAELLKLRFQLTGAYEDAAEGIRLIKEAIDILRRLSRKGNNSREARCLNILGEILLARYDKYGASEDIDEAIRACHASLDATDIDNVDYVPRAKSLSHVLGIRYGLLGKTIDFETAWTLVNSTLDSLQRRTLVASDREIALMFNQKGGHLLRKALRTKQNELFTEAVQSFSEAVRLDPDSITFSGNLSTAATRMALSAPSRELSKLALISLQKHLRTVMNHAPAIMDQERPRVLHSIAQISFALARKNTDNQQIGETANKALKNLVDLKFAGPSEKIWAAGELTVRLYQAKDYVGAAKYVNIAIENLPHLTTHGLSRADQLEAFKPHSNLPKFALALNVLAKTPLGKCLQLLEQSRSILWDRLLSEQTPIFELQAYDADLARKFEELRLRLHKPRVPALTGDRIDGMAFNMPDQYKDAEEYLSMLDEIRKRPGLGDFFKLVAEDHKFTEYAGEGPIVVVNCVVQYAHAVLVTRTGIINLNLPDFSEELAKLVYEKMQEAVRKMREDELEDANSIYLRVLNTLWRTVAHPVLDKLEEVEFREYRNTNRDLPRLWWVTNGWVNLLPIHAAGDFFQEADSEKNTRCTVMDCVVSSYIPSFRALEFARRNALSRLNIQSQSPSEAVIVSMPQTPNESPLPFASAEINAIKLCVPSYLSNVTELECSTCPKVLSALKVATHAHFICHGAVSATDPTLSHLKLANFPSGKPSSLDVRSILQASMPHLRSVFLSACNTGTTENMSLKDESLHISGAFLMRGVPEVVASRWEVVDELSVEVAGWFYKALASKDCDSNRESKTSGVVGMARALHQATKTARERGENAMFWGSYVHYGV